MTRKGKRLTYLVASLGLLVVLIAGYAFRDKAVEQWYLLKLESEDEEERKVGAEKLGEMGSARAIPQLVQTMGQNLTMMVGRSSYGNLSYLARITPVGDESAAASFGAVGSIAKSRGRNAVPYLLSALDECQGREPETKGVGGKDVKELEYQLVIMALASIGDDAVDAAPHLIAFLEEDPPTMSKVATIVALGKLDPRGKTVVPTVVAALNNEKEDFGVRCAAADTLGKIGRHAETAVSALESATQDKNERVREYAAEALKRLGERESE